MELAERRVLREAKGGAKFTVKLKVEITPKDDKFLVKIKSDSERFEIVVNKTGAAIGATTGKGAGLFQAVRKEINDQLKKLAKK